MEAHTYARGIGPKGVTLKLDQLASSRDTSRLRMILIPNLSPAVFHGLS